MFGSTGFVSLADASTAVSSMQASSSDPPVPDVGGPGAAAAAPVPDRPAAVVIGYNPPLPLVRVPVQGADGQWGLVRMVKRECGRF